MEKTYKVVIIGGGASGLLSAVELVKDNKISPSEILIVERNDRVGKKLIATGNGQGNLSNKNIGTDNYYGDKEFINSFLENAKELCIEKYFYSLGIPFCTEQNGRQYPLSKQASAVLDVLRKLLEYHGVKTITNCRAKKIIYKNNSFCIYTDSETFNAENVILAVGGKTAPQFGTDGTSYTLATDFGHKLSKLYPSIVQLKTETGMIRGLKGVKEVAKVTAFDGKKQLKSAVGDILFTEYGISGNAVFQISSEIPSVQNPSVKIEFLPNFSLEEVEKLLSDKLYILGNNFDDILVGIVNKKIGQAVINSVKERTCLSIAKALKNFNLKVTGTLGFNNAQVTKGGIFTDLIDSTSFESKLQKGLYIVGEVLNIDGECGGYNLTFAFISGILAGKSIKNKIN